MSSKKRKRSSNEGKPSTKQVHPDQLNQIAQREEAFVNQISCLNISESSNQRQKPSPFEEAKLNHYTDLKEAENEVTRKRTQSHGNSICLMEFVVNSKSKVYAVGTYEQFIDLCFAWKFNCSEEVIYNKERIENHRPMKLFCELAWTIALNKTKSIDRTLQALCHCINLVFKMIPEMSRQQIDATSLLVATYNDGKVIHLIVKIPEKYGIVTSLEEQKLFWSCVLGVAKQAKKNDNKNQIVQCLRVIKKFKRCLFDDWCMDTTTYENQDIFLQNLMSSNNSLRKEKRAFYLPAGKQHVTEVTKEEWLDHFVMLIQSEHQVKIRCKHFFFFNKL